MRRGAWKLRAAEKAAMSSWSTPSPLTPTPLTSRRHD
jgi:hypothetical protein